MTGFSAVNYSARFALPQILQEVVAEYTMGEASKGILLGAFCPPPTHSLRHGVVMI